MDQEISGRMVGGKYTILKRLGAGGMAAVYRARVEGSERHVALKIMPVHLAARDTLRQRFMREVRTASRLKHPHILPIYDHGEDGGTPYIVMKLVDGGTLDTIIEAHNPLPLRFVARTLAQVADALDYAHEQGVIHRDLKPENILFDRKGHAYLGDFGIARLNESTESLTGLGGFIGTAAYASPEQCRGEAITPGSDIYSLGVVLYEMLTGVQPFTGSSALAIMHQHISEAAPNPLKHRPELPIGINDVMRKALAKLPTVRYQSATAMSQALNHALREALGTHPLAGQAPPRGPDPVFTPPPDGYTAPAIPDELLPDLAPTATEAPAPEPPVAPPIPVQARTRPAPPRPQPNPPPRARRSSDRLLVWALVVIALVLLGVLIALALAG